MVIPANLQYVKLTDQESLGKYPDPAVPHPHAPGIEQLRDMPPMSETKAKNASN